MSSQDVDICIIGAGKHRTCSQVFQEADDYPGMGGLASALALAKKGFSNIHVYETASNLGFVGAGIQLAPNLARILDHLGVWAPIEAEATDVVETSIRQGSTDTELAHVDLSHIRKTYSHPVRSDLLDLSCDTSSTDCLNWRTNSELDSSSQSKF